MEETSQYHQCSKDDLIEMIKDRDQTIADLKKEIEGLKHPVPKDSTNSSIPTSKELIKRTRSQRQKSGKKPGGQPGHQGHRREGNPKPDKTVRIEASHCESCGADLSEVEGTVGQMAQEVDIPPIRPITIEYQQIVKVCGCGHCNTVALPIEAEVTIGPQMAALITYFNVEHSLPYGRLTQITEDVLGLAFPKERWPTNWGTCSGKPSRSSNESKPTSSHLPGADQTKREPILQEKSGGSGSGNVHRPRITCWISGVDTQWSKSILRRRIRGSSFMIAGVPKTTRLREPISSVMPIWCAICNTLLIRNARFSPIGFSDSCSSPNEPEMPSGKKESRQRGVKPSFGSIRMSLLSCLQCL